ncbi:MAG: RimK family alpha-L-glutamate ligase [Brevinematales bacterium]|nr:RimK family alpha-L-glutamate ligase [Brevinematales bacterium]
MGKKIAIFTERSSLRRSGELNALFRFREVAIELGHTLDFIFKDDIKYFKNYDAIFIRALTDPLNNSYVVSRLAELNGIKVLDSSRDIRICSDKVNMYSHLKKANVPFPETLFLNKEELTIENAKDILEQLGMPVVLKAPNSSFSAYVDRAYKPEDVIKIGKKFFRRADLIIVQQYMPSKFDYRVVMLNGKIISVVKYVMNGNAWRIVDQDENGKTIQCDVEGVDLENVNTNLLEVARNAGNSIGKGLYGIDIKEIDGEFYVIEVNDNPNIDSGLEDQKSPKIYEWIIKYLIGEDFEGLC